MKMLTLWFDPKTLRSLEADHELHFFTFYKKRIIKYTFIYNDNMYMWNNINDMKDKASTKFFLQIIKEMPNKIYFRYFK